MQKSQKIHEDGTGKRPSHGEVHVLTKLESKVSIAACCCAWDHFSLDLL